MLPDNKYENRINENLENLLKEVQLIAQIGHYKLDIITGIWQSSNGLDAIFGIDDNYKRDLVLWTKLIHPDFLEEMISYFQVDVLQNHNNFDKEYKIISRADKIEKWVHGRGVLRFNEKNEAVEMIGTVQDITDKKINELKVQKSEKTLNTIFDNAPVVMMLLDEDGKIVKLNRLVDALAIVSSSDLIGKKKGEFLNCIEHLKYPEGCGNTDKCYKCAIRNSFLHTLKTGEPINKYETEFISSNYGKEFHHTFLISTSRIDLESRNNVLISIDDITERKKMEEKIYENELTLNKIFDQAPVLMMLVNQRSEVIKINKVGKENGFSNIGFVEKPTCRTVFNCISTLKTENGENENELCESCIIYKTIQQTFKTGNEIFKKEADIITLNKSEISLKTYLVSSSLIEKGENAKILLTFDDITESKKIEEELMLSKEKSVYNEKRYRLLSNMTFEGIMLHKNGKIIDVNRSLAKMTGYSYSELIGQNSADYIFPEEYSSFLTQKLTEEYSFPYETEVQRKNGMRIAVEVESRYFKQNNQRIRVSAIRDITDRKMGEKRVLQAVVKTEENERARFAQELHDGLGPILSNVQMYFQWLAEADDNKQFVFEKGNSSLKNAFSTLREISNNLSPHILHNFGLVNALSGFIETLVIKNIQVDFKANFEAQRFNPDVEISLYRIVTELFNNSLKYSGATRIKLDLLLDKSVLKTIYTDDGKGFDIEEVKGKSKGFGMINIKNRIKTVQGTIKFISKIDSGLKVEINIPVY